MWLKCCKVNLTLLPDGTSYVLPLCEHPTNLCDAACVLATLFGSAPSSIPAHTVSSGLSESSATASRVSPSEEDKETAMMVLENSSSPTMCTSSRVS